MVGHASGGDGGLVSGGGLKRMSRTDSHEMLSVMNSGRVNHQNVLMPKGDSWGDSSINTFEFTLPNAKCSPSGLKFAYVATESIYNTHAQRAASVYSSNCKKQSQWLHMLRTNVEYITQYCAATESI